MSPPVAKPLDKKSLDINLNEVLLNPYNKDIDKDKVEEIKGKIKESGEIKPLVVTEVDNDGKKSLMLTDGHHRYHALKEMGYKTAPAVMADDRGTETAKEREPKSIDKAAFDEAKHSRDEKGRFSGGEGSPKLNVVVGTIPETGLRPAINDSGRIFIANDIAPHGQLFVRHRSQMNDTSAAVDGFVDDKGRFLTRDQTRDRYGVWASDDLDADGSVLHRVAKRKSNPAADKETELINENKKTAKFPHKFKAAEWTHPNGHPRCLQCGDEERIGGVCEKFEKAEWDESKHPRSSDGKFGEGSATEEHKDVSGRVLDEARAVPRFSSRYVEFASKDPNAPLTRTEQGVIDRYVPSGGLELGFVSNPLMYSDPLKWLNKNERAALLSLVDRGQLRVEERYDADKKKSSYYLARKAETQKVTGAHEGVEPPYSITALDPEGKRGPKNQDFRFGPTRGAQGQAGGSFSNDGVGAYRT